MAATLNSDQEELTFFSFPIEKQEDSATINPVDGTPDVWIWGKATDGTIDGDQEIVDPVWSAKALQEWADTGGNVRMSHDPKRPVGKGHQVHVTTDGHYVKSLISDPLAKHFIRQGVLNDYSVGISMPDFRHRDPALDPHGKASRIITGRPDGLSRVAELSVVDRGSNFNSRFQIVRKSAGNGDGEEFVGAMVGDEDEIAKAAPSGLLTKMARDDDDLVNVDLPKGASISISPADFAKMHTFKQQLVTKSAVEPDVEKRDVNTAERRSLAGEGNALPDGSYPIKNTGDLHNAAVLARSGHGDVAAARRLIARRAGELGVANPLDESDGVKKSISEEEVRAEEAHLAAVAPLVAAAVKEAEPEVIKDPEPEAKDKPVKKAKKAKEKPKKLPPWLNKPKDDDDSGDGKDGDDACKSVTDHLWTGIEGTSDVVCSKCHTTPAEAAGLTASHDMTAAPVPELLETPPVASMKSAPTPASASGAVAEHMDPVARHREPDGAIVEPFEKDASLPADGQGETPTRLEVGMVKGQQPEVSAMLRFKACGIDPDLGRLHDLTCPAFHPDDVAKYHPYAEFSTVIDERDWMRKALAAASGPTDVAKAMTQMWNSVSVLKAADPAVLNDFRLAAYKAFRDANPGPSSYPTPGMVSPQKYNRPLITDGHEASSPAHDGPNTSPEVASSAPNAMHFDRPPLAAGHQSPSPSHMKGSGGEYPSQQGVPVQLQYAHMEKDQARMALVRAHDQLGRQFPEVCPMDTPDSRPLRGQQPENHPMPATAGIGKGEGEPEVVKADDSVPALLDTGFVVPAFAPAALKAAPEPEGQAVDDAVYKGFKKMRKKLGKKVLAGEMTVDEARAKMGRQFAQKAAEPEVATKAAEPQPPEVRTIPDLIKSAVAEAFASTVVQGEPITLEAANWGADPEVIKAAVADATSELKDLLVKQQETFTAKLADQQKVIDAIADQPDPSTAAFSGLAFQPALTKTARPAGVTEIAENHAAQARHLVRQELENTYYTHSDPAAREAAAQAIARLAGGRQS